MSLNPVTYYVTAVEYLGSYISSTEKDIRIRKAHACRALHDLNSIWHSAMPDDLKRAIFMASVESILLYGSDAWTLTAVQEARLDGCYTNMLRRVFHVTWRDRVRNEVLYGDLPRITTKIRKRRLRMAGHCVRHPELAASNLVLWEPTQGQASWGGQSLTFINQLLRDTSLKTAADIRTCMEDRDVWLVIVARGESTRWWWSPAIVSVLLDTLERFQILLPTFHGKQNIRISGKGWR